MAAANRSRSPRPSCRWRDAAWKSTVSCFEDEPLPGFAKALAAGFDSGFEDFGFSAAVVACLLRADFVRRFAFFDVFLLMGHIWPSLTVNDSFMCCHWHKPRERAGREGGAIKPPGTYCSPVLDASLPLRSAQKSSEFASNFVALLKVFWGSDAQ